MVEELLRLKQCGPYRLAETTPFGVINNKHMLELGDRYEGSRSPRSHFRRVENDRLKRISG